MNCPIPIKPIPPTVPRSQPSSIQGSIAVNRPFWGMFFRALTTHQGKDVVSRSEQSVLAEVKRMTQQKGFNGIISDIGGPTANMSHELSE